MEAGACGGELPYLGVWLGFDAEMKEWAGQMASIRHRTRFIASLGTGWSLSCALYSMLVSSLVPYVGQFRDLPTRIGNEECYAQSRVFRQPQAGVPRTALAAMHALHPRVAISMFEHTDCIDDAGLLQIERQAEDEGNSRHRR